MSSSSSSSAYGELTGFARLAGDSELAPTSAARAELGRLAAREFRHYEALEERLRSKTVQAVAGALDRAGRSGGVRPPATRPRP